MPDHTSVNGTVTVPVGLITVNVVTGTAVPDVFGRYRGAFARILPHQRELVIGRLLSGRGAGVGVPEVLVSVQVVPAAFILVIIHVVTAQSSTPRPTQTHPTVVQASSLAGFRCEGQVNSPRLDVNVLQMESEGK